MKTRLRLLAWISRLTRTYGVPRGLDRFANWLVPPGVPSDGYDLIFKFDDGLWLSADLNSFLDRRLYLHGYYRKNMERLLQDVARESCVAFDCGANIGMYSLRLAQSVGAGGKVIAIEPHAVARSRLEANIHLNGFRDRITVLPCALSAACGTTTFHYPPPTHANQGNASLYRKGDDWLAQEVEVKTIDRIAEELGLSRVDIIRCDVQGEELNALKGGERVIRLFKPIVSLRYNENVASAAGLKIEELIQYLRGFGYMTFIGYRDSFVSCSDAALSVADAELLFIQRSNRLAIDRQEAGHP